jgi:hypothetical protein
MEGDMPRDRWKPILKKRTYCSPACGRGCTKAEHDEAVRKGNALCKRLGKGWKPRIWENLGWHFMAEKGDMSVSDYGTNAWANLHSESRQFPQHHATAKTPEKAVEKVLAEARKTAKALTLAAARIRE